MDIPSSYKTRALLPRPLRSALLTGDVGELHLTEIAAKGLSAIQDDPALFKERMSLYGDIALAAWEQVLSPNTGMLCRLDDVVHVLAPDIRRLIEEYTCPWESGDLPDARTMQDAAERADLPTPLRLRILADSRRLAGDIEGAADLYGASIKACPLPETFFRYGDCLAQIGNREGAVDAFRQHLARRPWSVHGLLRLYDVFFEFDTRLIWPEGQGALLIYTWNHADKLDEMLASLAASERHAPAGYPLPLLFALNNGSTDDTDTVLHRWKDRFAGRMSIIRTAVNMGAPAARNWLMSLPEVQACPWAVYLDDDVLLPPDWLGRFGTAMRAYPEAEVYGARVLSRDAAHELQSVDLHLQEPQLAADDQDSDKKSLLHHLNVSTLHNQGYDFGSFTYIRPCVSVTGCVHLFRMEALQEAGPFSLTFSPSQFDDFEHDLRRALQGKLPVYTGHLAIAHVQRSLVNVTRAHMTTVRSHLTALHLLYGPADVRKIVDTDARAAERDMHKKEAELRRAGVLE